MSYDYLQVFEIDEQQVKDHHRGPPSGECISGLFGTMNTPATIAHAWRGIKELTTGDTHALKLDIQFENLTSLDLKTVTIGTVLRLNGPACLQGTERLRNLALTVSIQFADRALLEKADIQFRDLFEALGCAQLVNLKILMINDGYHIGDDIMTQLDTGYFMDQLQGLEGVLETLSITFENADDESELEWLLDMCTRPTETLQNFSALRRLVIPQAFLFGTSSAVWQHSNNPCQPTVSVRMLNSSDTGTDCSPYLARIYQQTLNH